MNEDCESANVNAKVFVILFCATASLLAESAKVKQAIGSVIQAKGRIQTGSSSRIEVELPYSATVRIGSNTDFKFSPDAKKMSLESGTMLLSMPEKTNGVSVESGSIMTALSKGALEMSNVDGRVKVITLDGKVGVALAANPSDRRSLRAGQMVDVPAGATAMPPIVAVKLSTLIKTSVLINMGPFPGLRAIKQNATSQAPPRPFVTGGFDPDLGGSPMTQAGPATTAAMIARTEQGKPPLPPPVIPPGTIPTQAQAAMLEAAGLPIPNVSEADARRILRGQTVRPPVAVQPTPRPMPTRPPVVSPPIATPRPRPSQPLPRPRPTLRPPIAVP